MIVLIIIVVGSNSYALEQNHRDRVLGVIGNQIEVCNTGETEMRKISSFETLIFVGILVIGEGLVFAFYRDISRNNRVTDFKMTGK